LTLITPFRPRSVIPFPAWNRRVSQGSPPRGKIPSPSAFCVRLHPAGLNTWPKPCPSRLFHGMKHNRPSPHVINPLRRSNGRRETGNGGESMEPSRLAATLEQAADLAQRRRRRESRLPASPRPSLLLFPFLPLSSCSVTMSWDLAPDEIWVDGRGSPKYLLELIHWRMRSGRTEQALNKFVSILPHLMKLVPVSTLL
jgi:hypothetical protein